MPKPRDETHICVICGVEFPRRMGKNVTCNSPECRAELNRRWRRQYAKNNAKAHIGEPVTCPICGTVFPRKCAGAKYCSPACSKTAAKLRKYRNERIGTEAVCEVCGKPYIVKGAKQRYCSNACCGKAARMREQEQERQKKAKPAPKKRGRPKKIVPGTIEDIVRNAMARGMSYGQYVAAAERGML